MRFFRKKRGESPTRFMLDGCLFLGNGIASPHESPVCVRIERCTIVVTDHGWVVRPHELRDYDTVLKGPQRSLPPGNQPENQT